MKKFLFLLLLPLVLNSQAIHFRSDQTTGFTFPFATGNDTILSAANLTSNILYMKDFRGAITIGLQFSVIGSGTAKDIDVYWKERLSGLDWGVPSDSLGADSLHIFKIDSQYVKDEDPVYIKLTLEPWWGYAEEGILILDPASGADSIYVISRVPGQ